MTINYVSMINKKNRSSVGSIYIIGMREVNNIYKIGMTDNFVEDRMSDLQVGNPFELYIVYQTKVPYPQATEKEIHSALAKCRLKGEWFDLSLYKPGIEIDSVIDLINIDKKKYKMVQYNGKWIAQKFK